MSKPDVEALKAVFIQSRIEEEKRGFRWHLTTYGLVNTFLVGVNLVTSPDALWFYWPLGGWGLGLAGHYFGGVRNAEHDARRELEQAELKAQIVGNG